MISIILLHHNKAEYSRACLHSLLRTASTEFEVINVDNGSRDGTPEVLDEWERDAAAKSIPTQRLVFPENIGAIRGRNEAMHRAHGKYFVFLDNDTLVAQPDWLAQMRAFLEADPQRGIVAPKLVFPWEPFHIECCGAAVSPGGRIKYLARGQERYSLTDPQKVQCAISAAWMFPRRVYDAIGELDEVYSPVQYEDLDYCYRAREAGFEVWTLPSVEIYHFEHTTTAGSDDINFRYLTAKNSLTFKKKWGKQFAREAAISEEAAQWETMPKRGIEEVDWCGLLAG